MVKTIVSLESLTLKEVVITAVENDTCFANLVLSRVDGNEDFVIDSRPSDARNLALRVGAPIMVKEQEMEEWTVLPLPGGI